MRTIPWTTSGSSSCPTTPRRGAWPRSTTRDVPDADGDAVLLRDDDVLDVVHVVHEADPADVVRLLADREALAADVLVGVLDRLLDLLRA